MNVVVSNQNGRAYSAKTENPVFVGKKIGETVSLDELGLKGYEGVITGGSDLQGFPMRVSLMGTIRKKILTTKGVGFKGDRKGQRRRVSVRGNTISSQISQINIKITKKGSVNLNKFFGKEEDKQDKKVESAKERMVRESLEQAGKGISTEEFKKMQKEQNL